MTFRESLASLFGQPLLANEPQVSFAASTGSILHDGVWVGQGKRKARFRRYPDGEIRKVDMDFDPAVFDDPDSVPTKATRSQVDAEVIDVPDVEPAADNVTSIARAMLLARPESLVAVYHDAKGKVLGATSTPATRGLTAAVFRAAFRSLPSKAKQVTFAARCGMTSEIRDAATMAADAFLVRILDFVTL